MTQDASMTMHSSIVASRLQLADLGASIGAICQVNEGNDNEMQNIMTQVSIEGFL